MLPGWNTIDSASRYHDVFRQMEIVCFFLGVILELIALFIGRRKLKLGIEIAGIVSFFAVATADYIVFRYEQQIASLIQARQPQDNSSLESQIIAKALSQIGAPKLPQSARDALIGQATTFCGSVKKFLADRESGNPMNKPTSKPATAESSNVLDAQVFAYRNETVKLFRSRYGTQCTALALEFSKYGVVVGISGEFNECLNIDHPSQIEVLIGQFSEARNQVKK